MSRPSDDMTLEELREEYDWIYEFQSRMAERISGNPDVHNHVDYVNQLEIENAKLRELVRKVEHYEQYGCYECPHSNNCDIDTLYDEDCAMSLEIEREKRVLGIEVDA